MKFPPTRVFAHGRLLGFAGTLVIDPPSGEDSVTLPTEHTRTAGTFLASPTIDEETATLLTTVTNDQLKQLLLDFHQRRTP